MTKYYEGIIRQEKSNLFLCDIPELETPIKINKRFINKSISGDKVLLKVKDDKYGFVQKLIERPVRILTGKIKINNNITFIKPWNNDIFKDFFVDINDLNTAKNDDVVEFQIVEWNKNQKAPKAKIIKILHSVKPEDFLLYKLNLPTKFSEEVLEELKTIEISNIDKKDRIDLTNLDVFSIDPENCRDIDDALSFEQTSFGYRIGIHIADVSNFVKTGSNIDREAYKRSFTIYFPNSNIPMLPEKLSSDLCSLLEGKDRFCVSTIINFDKSWNIIDYHIFKSIINNKKKFTYEEAQEHKNNSNSPYYTTLNSLYLIGNKIRKELFPDEIVLDLNNISWELDENNNPLKIKIKKKLETSILIQAWMLICNKLTTLKIEEYKLNHPWIYRIHNDIDEESLTSLIKEVKQLDLNWNLNISNNENIKLLLKTNKSKIVSEILIKKFRPAKYSPFKEGHFSLGIDTYTHFTSPIRRYSDIIVHRILLNIIAEKPVYCANLWKDCQWISKQESKIQKVENYYNSQLNIKFLQNVKYDLKAEIIQMNKKGIFLKIENSIYAWIVSKDLKKNNFLYDNDKMKWHNNITDYKITDIIDVKVKYLNLDKNEIEMIFSNI